MKKRAYRLIQWKNSTYLYHKNFVADSKENYKLDPGVEELTSTVLTLFQKDYLHNITKLTIAK